jgi:uncharacterized protein (TIGR02444 family)
MAALKPSTAQDGSSAFWNFSLQFYARPQVAAACLELQDSAGVDVNIVLYLLFLARHHRSLTRADVARIDAMVSAWRVEVVLPLRTLRRRLKRKSGIPPVDIADSDALRTDIKRIELDSERIEQHVLERHAAVDAIGTAAPSPADAARANLAAYGEIRGGLPAAAVDVLLKTFNE